MNSPFCVFLSSTWHDLKEHRRHVIDNIRKGGFSVDPMEDWAAAPDEPRRFSVRRVRECDLCVLLVALRRGHVPQGGDLSITQLEYKAAIDNGFDVLVFMLDEQSPWPRQFDDLDNDPEIVHWRQQLREGNIVGSFDNDPKSIEILAALSRWQQEKIETLRKANVAHEELKHIIDRSIKARVVNRHDVYRWVDEVRASYQGSQEAPHRLR